MDQTYSALTWRRINSGRLFSGIPCRGVLRYPPFFILSLSAAYPLLPCCYSSRFLFSPQLFLYLIRSSLSLSPSVCPVRKRAARSCPNQGTLQAAESEPGVLSAKLDGVLFAVYERTLRCLSFGFRFFAAPCRPFEGT